MTTITLSAQSYVLYPRPNPQASLRLICFPYAGGGASVYRTWPDELPGTVELCAIQLPGRGVRLNEPAFTSLPPLVEALAKVLLPCLDKPFAFFGHSMGALISFELARLLQKQHGLIPRRLFVSGRSAPQVPDTRPSIHGLPEPLFLEELRKLNGTPGEVLAHPELVKLVLPSLRADFELCETYTYQPGPPLECPISAYGSLQDDRVSIDRLEPWRAHTRSSFNLRMFPGDHFYLNSHRQLLLQMLAQEQLEIMTAARTQPGSHPS